MTALVPMPKIDSSAGKEEHIDEAELAAARSSLAIRVGPWRRTGTTCGRSSSGLATKGSSSLRTGPPDIAHRRQGQQAGGHPPGAQDGPNDRPGDRGTYRWADLAPPRRQPARPPYGPPVGPLDRQASRTRPRAPPHAAGGVHHVRPRGGSPTTRSADRCPSRRPADYDRLRPPPPELRQACGLRRRGLRGGWMICPPSWSVATGESQARIAGGSAMRGLVSRPTAASWDDPYGRPRPFLSSAYWLSSSVHPRRERRRPAHWAASASTSG